MFVCVCLSKAGPHETADTFSPSLSCCAENVKKRAEQSEKGPGGREAQGLVSVFPFF